MFQIPDNYRQFTRQVFKIHHTWAILELKGRLNWAIWKVGHDWSLVSKNRTESKNKSCPPVLWRNGAPCRITYHHSGKLTSSLKPLFQTNKKQSELLTLPEKEFLFFKETYFRWRRSATGSFSGLFCSGESYQLGQAASTLVDIMRNPAVTRQGADVVLRFKSTHMIKRTYRFKLGTPSYAKSKSWITTGSWVNRSLELWLWSLTVRLS